MYLLIVFSIIIFFVYLFSENLATQILASGLVLLFIKSKYRQVTSPEYKKSKGVKKLLKTMVEKKGIKVKDIKTIGYPYDSSFWIAVSTDLERDKLLKDKKFHDHLHTVFEKTGYLKMVEDFKKQKPPVFCPELYITYQSQETVDRDYEGSWFYAMK